MNARSSQALTALPLIAAAALVAAPAAAQEVAAPPVTATQAAPAPQTVAPPPVVATNPAPATPAAQAAAPATGSSATSIDPQAASNAAAEQVERRAATRATRAPTTARATAPTRPAATRVVTPVARPEAAPAPAPAPAAASAPAPAAPAARVETTGTSAAQTSTTTTAQRDGSIWPWVVAAIAAIGIAAGLVLWRRRRAREEAWEETAYTTEPEPVAYAEPVAVAQPAPAPEPRPVAQPVAAAAVAAPAMPDGDAPVATAEEASVARADAGDVEALTAAAPVSDRPWLELAMRPVRAGTTDDDARVEIELTVGNAGPVDADEVHVSAFMLADADDGEIERMLVNPPAADAVEPLRIGAGEGTRVDATLTLPRASLASEARFRPVVIAEARYRLPGGGEGRTAASFDVGMVGEPDAPLAPVTTAGTEMRDDVEARLHRAAEHA